MNYTLCIPCLLGLEGPIADELKFVLPVLPLVSPRWLRSPQSRGGCVDGCRSTVP